MAIRKKLLITLASSFLLLLVAVGVIFTPELLHSQSDPSAYAASNPSDVNWHIGDGKAGYTSMLNAIRANFATYYHTSRITDATSSPSSSTPRFLVNIYTGSSSSRQPNRAPDMTLILRSDNLYIEGWLNHATNVIFRLQDANDPPGLPNAPTAAIQALPFGSVYSILERTGAPRDGMNINLPSVTTDINSLNAYPRTGATQAQNKAVATAIIRFAQAIAEAARFAYIGNQIATAIADPNGGSAKMDAADIYLENNWGGMSSSVESSLNNGSPVKAYTIPAAPSNNNRGQTLNTVAALTAIIAILLRPNVQGSNQ